MKEKPSNRLIDQRIRNRIMEAVEILANGDDGVNRVWPTEFFESFYDWIPHHSDGAMPSNCSINSDENALLIEVRAIVDCACDATPSDMTAVEFIATGWPKRIQPVATRALALMRSIGSFSEDREEESPSK